MNTSVKKTLIVVCALLLTVSAYAAPKKSIVCTTFPEYDWIMNILGNKNSSFNVTLLQNNGTDLHSYQPSVSDITKISKADLFVFVGGESDEWVEKVVESSVNANQVVVNMLEVLGDKVREEELVEGMQPEDEDDEEDGEEEIEYDEHVWLSLSNAMELTRVLCSEISKLDAANAGTYEKKAAEYISKLAALDRKYAAAVAAASKKTVLFGDRFPFRYLADDYGISYYAAFPGCSAESEASFETIMFLARTVDSLKLPAVLTIEKNNGKIARTIVESTTAKNQQILEMDSLQSITTKEIKKGRSYLSAMEKNLEVLKIALQ